MVAFHNDEHLALSPTVFLAAGLSISASLFHLWLAPQLLGEWWTYGVFFRSGIALFAAAALQGLYAIALLRWPHNQLLLAAGLAICLPPMAFYLLVGSLLPSLSTGPAPTVIAGAELATALCLLSLLKPRLRPLAITLLIASATLLWTARLTFLPA